MSFTGRLQSEDAGGPVRHSLPGSHFVAHGRALWKLTGPWTHRTRPPRLGKRCAFSTSFHRAFPIKSPTKNPERPLNIVGPEAWLPGLPARKPWARCAPLWPCGGRGEFSGAFPVASARHRVCRLPRRSASSDRAFTVPLGHSVVSACKPLNTLSITIDRGRRVTTRAGRVGSSHWRRYRHRLPETGLRLPLAPFLGPDPRFRSNRFLGSRIAVRS